MTHISYSCPHLIEIHMFDICKNKMQHKLTLYTTWITEHVFCHDAHIWHVDKYISLNGHVWHVDKDIYFIYVAEWKFL